MQPFPIFGSVSIHDGMHVKGAVNIFRHVTAIDIVWLLKIYLFKSCTCPRTTGCQIVKGEIDGISVQSMFERSSSNSSSAFLRRMGKVGITKLHEDLCGIIMIGFNCKSQCKFCSSIRNTSRQLIGVHVMAFILSCTGRT